MIGTGHRLTGEGGRPDRFDDKALDVWVVLFEGRGPAGKGAAGADKVAEGVDGAAGLPQDLRPSMQVLGSLVRLESKLIPR